VKTKKIKVVFFQRKPTVGSFSVEYIFDDVRSRLSDEIISIKFVSRFLSIGFFKRVYNIFEAFFHQGDVNHVTGDVHFLTFLLPKKRTVLTILDCVFMNRQDGLAKKILKLFWLTIPIKKSTYITAISEATKKEIVEYSLCNPDKVKVIPVAISSKFKPSSKEFSKSKPVLLHVGMAPNKNFPRLIEALSGLSVKLSVIGKLNEEYISLLKRYSIDYENSYNLTDDEIKQKYSECDILTFVSTFEGFGMPILEAQATGRVVVTSNISSMPEVAGEAAVLIDPFDIDSIRSGIISVIENEKLRESLIQKGFENVKRYDPDLIAKQYEELYLELYEKSRENQCVAS